MGQHVWFVVRTRDARVVSRHESIEEANAEVVKLNTEAVEHFVTTNDDYEKLYAVKEFYVFGVGRKRDELRHGEVIEARTRFEARDIFEKQNPELRAVSTYDRTVD